jgi:hypothetical protein
VEKNDEDIRALTGGQPFVQEAPVNFVYVADFSQMGKRMVDEDFLFCC